MQNRRTGAGRSPVAGWRICGNGSERDSRRSVILGFTKQGVISNMNKSFSERIHLIRSRRNPDNRVILANSRDVGLLKEAQTARDDLHRFIFEAMCEVDEQYTLRTKNAGEKVKRALGDAVSCEFRYQGSVMTDTHIKGASDIDLLCLGQRSEYGETAKPARERRLCSQRLKEAGYNVVDGAKSLQVKPSANSVKVDVVNGTWNTSYHP